MAADQLARIQKQIKKLVQQEEKFRKSAIKNVVAQINKLMEEHGISVADLRGTKRRRPGRKPAGRKTGRTRVAGKKPAVARTSAKRRPKAKAKYRSPDKKSTWTGRGRKPAWVSSWLESGKKLDDLLIK